MGISFYFGSEILKRIGPHQPQKKNKKRLMDFHDGISCQRFKLEGWGLVQCLLISFCFGSEILKKIGPPQPQKKPKKNPKKTYGFSRWDILPMLIARRLGFGTLFTNIILLWIRNFEKNPTTRSPQKKPKNPKKRLMDFHDGISCQRFELEGWDLVHCLLISFCFGSEILKKIRPLEPPKKPKKPPKKDLWIFTMGYLAN